MFQLALFRFSEKCNSVKILTVAMSAQQFLSQIQALVKIATAQMSPLRSRGGREYLKNAKNVRKVRFEVIFYKTKHFKL